MTQSEINYNAGAQYRAQIFQEINANPINVDRSCFQKTKSDRKEIKDAQAEQGRRHKFTTWLRLGADEPYVNAQVNAKYGLN